MGKYINNINGLELGQSYRDKCAGLLHVGAKEVNGKNYEENLVCVVDMTVHSAAGYVYDEDEYEEFSGIEGRPKSWFILKDAHIHANN